MHNFMIFPALFFQSDFVPWTRSIISKMIIKNIIIVIFSLSLVGYVVFLKIKEHYLVERVTCSDEACVRFCCISDCNFQFNTSLKNVKALENRNFTPIDGRLCRVQLKNDDPWMFKEVMISLKCHWRLI